MAKMIGLFLDGDLIIEYPNEPEAFLEVANDLKEQIEETGLMFEVRFYEEIDGPITVTRLK